MFHVGNEFMWGLVNGGKGVGKLMNSAGLQSIFPLKNN